MKIAVLGTGMVGQAIAGRLAELGHDVITGTRDPEATLARTEPDGMGNPPYAAWATEHPHGRRWRRSPRPRPAPSWSSTPPVGPSPSRPCGPPARTALAGKVVIDISNPLDFSQGFPPTLFVKDTDCLGEQIQREFPQARRGQVPQHPHRRTHGPPRRAGEDSSVFVSGNDAAAKATVTALLESFGHTDVIDLGDITTARGAEMLLPVWLRLMGALGTGCSTSRSSADLTRGNARAVCPSL